jgi:hypothetical protein
MMNKGVDSSFQSETLSSPSRLKIVFSVILCVKFDPLSRN